ncbi:E3 ubiquitin-protein ligase tom1 [Xanthoria calcicola]
MGRIKKAAGPKHEATVSPAIAEFVAKATSLPVAHLPAHLQTFPSQWPFPRGDLYHWIPLLDLFDLILKQINHEYGLQHGPQTIPFARTILEKGVSEDGKDGAGTTTSQEELDKLGFSHDGDKYLVQTILAFSQELLENCGNRSLYNSSDRLGHLLNTTDLSLLRCTLQLAVRLAQRYYASKQRGANASQHLNNALLASHYNIDLNKVQCLANPFSKTALSGTADAKPAVPGKGISKGKQRSRSSLSEHSVLIHPSDLVAIACGHAPQVNGSMNRRGSESTNQETPDWEQWGNVQLKYYQTPSDSSEFTKPTTPTTPTPTRRTSILPRPSRLSTTEDPSDTPVASPTRKTEETGPGGMKSLDIPFSKISTTPINDILKETLPELPKDSHYEFLSKLRVASGIPTAASTRHELLIVRLLALTNLAYVYSDAMFQQKILQSDSDEPRRLQLAYQLAELLQPPPGNANSEIPLGLQTVAFGALESLTRHKSRASDVCAALNINVNHGVLFHSLKKAVADMATEDGAESTTEEDRDQWREALFSLLEALPTCSPRTGEALIAAGLFDNLIEMLNLRTIKAERHHHRVLTFLNTIVYTVRDAFQTLANAKGLDTISDLVAFEVESSLESAKTGQGMPAEYRNQNSDYQIPYYQQQTLRWLFKFINHMMSHAGGNNDRLLRNLVDSPQLLGGLKTVIVNARIFGSSVWSGAGNILSAFMNNEPTSYGIIAEAGLSKGFLEAVSSETITEAKTTTEEVGSSPSTEQTGETAESSAASSLTPAPNTEAFAFEVQQARDKLAEGILPATDAILTVPQVIGAICLNNAGLELLLRSRAMGRFFEIFESPEHIKSMNTDEEFPRMLGNSFDELVRHYPQLKQPIMLSVVLMIGRVSRLCKSHATERGLGAQLYIDAGKGKLGPRKDSDVVMDDADNTNENELITEQSDRMIAGSDGDEMTAAYIGTAMKFLGGFFESPNICSAFVDAGGVELVLDIATLPCLQYNFKTRDACRDLARVVHMLVEQKPHLAMPSLIKRTQAAVDGLEPLHSHTGHSAFFEPYTALHEDTAGEPDKPSIDGTEIVKNLVTAHILTNVLMEAFGAPIYNARSSHTVFTQVNLTDLYITLIESLGRLHRICIWEEILLQKKMPSSWKEATRITTGYGIGSQEADDVLGLPSRDDSIPGQHEEAQGDVENGADNEAGVPTDKKRRQSSIRRDESRPEFQNVRTLRYLLSQLPGDIAAFFQVLGKALIVKRRPDSYARQNAYMMADALSAALLEQIAFQSPMDSTSAQDRYSYWIVALTSISHVLVERLGTSSGSQCLTLVLQAFKSGGGLTEIKRLLEVMLEEVRTLSGLPEDDQSLDTKARETTAHGGIRVILELYTQISAPKIIIESAQTTVIQSNERDRGQPHYFLPPQFLVELRMAILPMVRSIWDSDFVDKAASPIVKWLIEILRIGLESNEEQGAYKRGDKLPIRAKHTHKVYNVAEEKFKSLKDMGFDADIAREALYRCYNGQHHAEEYCRARQQNRLIPRIPIPVYDQEPKKAPSSSSTPVPERSEAPASGSQRAETPAEDAQPSEEQAANPEPSNTASSTADAFASAAEALVRLTRRHDPSTATPPPAPGVPGDAGETIGEAMTRNIDNLLNISDIVGGDLTSSLQPGSSAGQQATPSTPEPSLVAAAKIPNLVTVNDLDDERSAIRENLIERALDVLNLHNDVTFELADLINAAALRAPDSNSMRRDIGETLVQSLISLQLDDDFRPAGKKIAAYANLLGLVLQDHDFYQATLDELRSCFGQLLGFIKIFPDQKTDEPSPWIGQVLLVVERVLSEDAQPVKIQWTHPGPETKPNDPPVAVLEDPLLSLDDKVALFDALIDILPRIGKDDSLALSVVRALAIVTRSRNIANKLAEKKNIQRLFVMMKQLAGSTNERLQSSFMLILRHIVEDDDSVRQIMRSEIVQNFESRTNRNPTDTTAYVRQMYHLALRSPELFVEITNEKLEIKDFDSSPNPHPQILALKNEAYDSADAGETGLFGEGDHPASNSMLPETDPLGTESGQESKDYAPPIAESTEIGTESPQKPKPAEAKAPVIEHPSGVIHYILCEILSYKEVEDKDPSAVRRKPSQPGPSETPPETSMDADLGDANVDDPWISTQLLNTEAGNSNDEHSPEKAEFKAEQHPIYVYRCFLLQCLAELLFSYDQTKIEFINFSRKADPKAITPSKPRSGVLNYLLNDLIPVGTLNYEEGITFRKKSSTSHFALSVIVALCLKTNENGYAKRRAVDEENDTQLLFVRKFALEHALKAYRDANGSSEALDVKYARLLSLADLFDRLLQGRLVQNNGPPSQVNTPTQKQIAKLMFEKNFLSALTTSIADIDLNFPQSKRAIKYILRPLKQLTSTAIHLSETSSISDTPGPTDEDEISSASSVSEMDDEREETPDLFRNSTLGMFEPGREAESSSESSDDDEEMYDEEYNEGMEYEEEMERDADEVISDEDEEVEGAGPVEGLPEVQFVMEHGENDPMGEDDDDDDEGSSEDIESLDEDDEVQEVIDEITGDDGDSLAGGEEEEEWQDEDDAEGDDFNEENMAHDVGHAEETHDAETAVRNILREFGGDEAALERITREHAHDIDMDAGTFPDGRMQADDDAEDDNDDDEADDDDLLYQTEFADQEQGMPDPPWGWDPDDEAGIIPPRHHHHAHRRMISPWTIFPAGHPSDRGPIYRTHRAGGPRAPDDGTNPLLRREGRDSGVSAAGRAYHNGLLEVGGAIPDNMLMPGMESGLFPRHNGINESPVSFVNNLIAAIGQGGPGGPHGGFHFTIPGPLAGGRVGAIPRELQTLLGYRPSPPEPNRTLRETSNNMTTFSPQATHVRWQEEARLLFGNSHAEKAQRIINSLLKVLVPPAFEKKKLQEEQIKARMERVKEQERKAKEAMEKEKAEKEEEEKQEREDREQREAAAAADTGRQSTGEQPESGEESGAMEGVETFDAFEQETGSEDDGDDEEATEAPAAAEEPAGASASAPQERIRITIRGRELDITDMGIDLEYLEALPEEMREEVLMHQLALQRSQAVAAGEAPSDISREFLEALPPEIREELLQQEAQDRRRREREEDRRRRNAENGTATRGEEMDTASFLASLDPGLRQVVLMDQDEDMINQLPATIAAEARALGGDRGYRGYHGGLAHHRARVHNTERDTREPQASKKPQRKQIVQMLDKAGVATLLRLMFVPQQGSSRQSLNNILHDVSQNRQTRAEVINLLLLILQDGSTDVNAVERSFAQLSLRAKQPGTQKTPQPPKRSLTGSVAPTTNSEMTPLMVVQQCLNALVFLTQYNPHIPSFFLTEHENLSAAFRTKSSRKGKGRETKASKFALNALLSLLDRKLIMESSSCMEQLSSILQAVTHPLTMLLRQSKEKAEKTEKAEGPADDHPMENAESAAPATEIQTGESDTQPAGPTSVETGSAIPQVAAEAPPVDVPIIPDPSPEDGATAGEEKPAEPTKSDDEKAKKQRTLTPPVVPEENLRLVVNILAARECSAKTFRDTLSTINNLSAIPDAKDVFGKGLIEQAQDLGQSILNDLDELTPQIKQAESGTDIQAMALAKFSPASSDQAKLLRILTALDYLFDPKRNNGKTKSAADDETKTGEQEDILAALYENAIFGSLWSKLSDCLGAIRHGDGTLNIATILLPLIEALMVVCKNTTLKDAPLAKTAKEFSVASPPPESRMENLFFRFTEDHRKILNDLVRHNPKLMSGTFCLLVKNPKVLEFDNKRNYFNRRLHSRTENRQPQPALQLNIRRDQVFLDSYKFMHFKSGDEIKFGKLNIRFHGEEGVDAGGVSREWFQVLSRQMFNPAYALFVPVASDKTTFHPNRLSHINEEHLDFFKFIGRIIGKALYEGRALDCHFSRAVYKRILGKSVSIKDMETLDLDYYKSLLWMLENDITDVITETFSMETDAFGVTEIIDLVENGRNIPVTEENKHEYAQRVVEYRLTGSVQTQLEKFLGGFHDVVPPELIAIFNEQELELLISGLPDIDIDDWKNNTEYHNYSASSSQIQWFWRAVRSFDKEERAKLLQFVTGTSKVPLNGFRELEGMNGFSRFNIHRAYGNKDRLPSSHTCFNQLDLPEYDSYEQLRQQVYTAMTAGSEYFGFA